MKYPKTFSLIQATILFRKLAIQKKAPYLRKTEEIECIEDFTISEKQTILLELFDECDDELREDMVNGVTQDKKIARMILGLTCRISDEDFMILKRLSVNIHWDNVRKDILDMFDIAIWEINKNHATSE